VSYRASNTTAAAVHHPKGVLVHWGAKLPRLCLACGATKGLRRRGRLGDDDMYPVVYGAPAAALAGNLFALLIRLLRGPRKAVALSHWRCTRCDAAMKESAGIPPVLLIGPFLALLLGIIVGFATQPLWGWLAAFGAAVCVVLVARASLRSAGLSVVEVIDSEGVVLAGLSPKAADALLALRLEPQAPEAGSSADAR
jgi:hypothetical protein